MGGRGNEGEKSRGRVESKNVEKGKKERNEIGNQQLKGEGK
jgi:hypothetical protein